MMGQSYKSVVRWFLVSLFVAFATALAAGAFASGGSGLVADGEGVGSSKQSEVTTPDLPTLATKDFPTNALGQTYGSDAFVAPSEAPDLVAVVGDHGISGYCSKDELYPKLETPAEVARYKEAGGGNPEVCTVVASDGTTVLDTSTALSATVSYGHGEP